jgi:hypothetical protein
MAELVIRQEQMSKLSDSVTCRWICNFLGSVYPEMVLAAGRNRVMQMTEQWMKEAHALGFREAADIRKYAHVAFLFGPEFPKHPRFVWARKILDNPDFHHTGARLRALEDATIRHFEAVKKSVQEV